MTVFPVFDLITVVHNERNYKQSLDLEAAVAEHAEHPYVFWRVDNRPPNPNRGFGPACNLGSTWGDAPIIGFLNPDVLVQGPFMQAVLDVLKDPIVITGERFGKPDWELKYWGCRDWVCGASLFTARSWWLEVGGFDARYEWGWEESDLIRRAQQRGKRVKSISLPIEHSSPDVDTPQDAEYKRLHFEAGAKLFRQKWGGA